MILVVHIISKLELGGAQENTLQTCAGLDRSRFDVALMYGPGGILDREAESLEQTTLIPIPAMKREIDPRADLTALRQIQSALRDLERRHQERGNSAGNIVVHTHSSKAGILGRSAARVLSNASVVHSIHGFGFHEGQAKPRFLSFLMAEKAAARLTHGFISVSRSNLAEAFARGICNRSHRTVVIRSGFSLERFEQLSEADRTETRRALGVDESAEVILSVGNLKQQKDPLTLVEAAKLLLARRPKAVVLFAGDGELRSEVSRELERAGLEDRFILLGWRRDVPELMAACDVVVLSSLFEGLPKVCVQAIAAQRPFVGTRVDGVAEVIQDGRNGFLVEPRDSTALAHALERALDERPVDPEDRKRIRSWDVKEMVRAQEEFYLQLISDRSSSTGRS